MKKTLGPVQHTVILVVFIVAAILSSLFIFHLRHQQKPILATNDITLFNAARSIKDFDLIEANGEAFKHKNLRGHWTLMLFGFTHCSDVCPASLDMLARAYKELKPRYPTLQVVLVSLDPTRDTNKHLLAYTKQFHPDFIGTTGSIEALRKLQSQLGIYAAKEQGANGDYQIQHTSSILLLNPKGEWAGAIRYGLTPTQFVSTFHTSIKAITG